MTVELLISIPLLVALACLIDELSGKRPELAVVLLWLVPATLVFVFQFERALPNPYSGQLPFLILAVLALFNLSKKTVGLNWGMLLVFSAFLIGCFTQIALTRSWLFLTGSSLGAIAVFGLAYFLQKLGFNRLMRLALILILVLALYRLTELIQFPSDPESKPDLQAAANPVSELQLWLTGLFAGLVFLLGFLLPPKYKSK